MVIFIVFFWMTGAVLIDLTDHLPTDLPPEFNCNGAQNRIVGGVTTQPDTWPFIVRIEGFKSRTKAHSKPNYYDLCGGSIIHDQWILTGKVFFNTKFCQHNFYSF